MHVKRSLLPLGSSLVGSLVFGCADRPPHTAEASTTAAQMSSDHVRSQISELELERERDEARAALAQERATQEGDRLRKTDEASSKAAHDDLEVRAMTALDRADQDAEALRAKSAHASVKDRQSIDKALEGAHTAKAKIYAELKRLHGGDIGPSWDSFRATVDQDIAELQNVLAIDPDLPDLKTKPKAQPVERVRDK